MDKKELRQLMKARQEEFLRDRARVESETSQIIEAIERNGVFKEARTILAYMSIPGEVPLHQEFDKWAKAGKRIVLPKVCGDTLLLKEYAPSQMQPGYKGILEPGDSCPDVSPDEIDLALIPGVAFASTTEPATLLRLGRGKGFYDRLLPHLHCTCGGVYYSFRLVKSIPTDIWDAPLAKLY